MEIDLKIILTIIGLMVSVTGILLKIKDRKEVFRKEFKNIRTQIKKDRRKIQKKALHDFSKFRNRSLSISSDFPLLTKKEWLPDLPVEIDDFKTVFGEDIKPNLARSIRIGDYKTYSEAIVELDKPRMFNNNPQYRLLDIEKDKLIFSKKDYSYFDKIDYGGLLLHQFAANLFNKKRKPDYNRISRNLSQPHDYIVLSGVCTLTLLVSEEGANARFLFCKRKNDLGTAEGTFHVIPAGEFQPSSLAGCSFEEDLSIWKNIMRESAEEILGKEEFEGNDGISFDYDSEPYIVLEKAKSEGNLKVFYLGIGLDPLSFHAEILTCVVYKENTFISIFGKEPKKENDESILINQKDRWGIDVSEIQMYKNDKNTLSASIAIFDLVLKNMELLKNSVLK